MKCELCPHMCGADRENGETGFCSAGNTVKIARAALHYWEEPCISGKEGSGTVFFSCCTLKCIYCQNYKISSEHSGKEITVPDLAGEFLRLAALGANNINLVTPTHYIPQIKEALDIAARQGLNIPIVYNTGGYERTETIKSLDGYIDIYLPDMKYFSSRYSLEYSGVRDYFAVAKDAIAEMYRQVGKPVFDKSGIMKRGVIVRHLMLPSLLFDTKKIIDYLYSEYGSDIYISLMNQYTPMPHMKNHPRLSKRLDSRHYSAMINYCIDKGMENVFVQEDGTADERFIPDFL